MKKIIFLFAPLCAMLMVGCVKDEPNATFIKLYAEGFTPDNSAKAAVIGESTYWVNGDKVWINNYAYTVNVTGSSEAVASDIYQAPDHIYRAVYPDGVYVTNEGNNVTIKVPKQYAYKVDGSGRQVLDSLPMVAYYDGSAGDTDPEDLSFKHLTAAITVHVKNTCSQSIHLNRIELINSEYQLAGDVVVDISGAAGVNTPTVSPVKKAGGDMVQIVFTEAAQKTLANGQTLDVQIPILPVGGSSSDATLNSNFTIRVYGNHEGTRYTYGRSTGERNNSIARGCLGYAVAKYADNDVYTEIGDLFDSESKTITVNGESVTKDFYKISTPDELLNLSAAMDNNWAKSTNAGADYKHDNYQIVNDIDLHGSTITPIHYYNEGATDEANRCYFYGGGNTVSNFTESSVGENEPNCCGFFGKTAGDYITVTDLNIDKAQYEFAHVNQKLIDPDHGYSYTDNNPVSTCGGVFAMIDKKGIEIVNCTVQNLTFGSVGDVMSGESQTDFYASGLVGLVTTGVTIRNCYVGTVIVNNNETKKDALVDQFGPAIGRIDVGDEKSRNSYEYYKEYVTGKSGLDAPTTLIENFTYDQGATELTFCAGLKNIRCGGVVANVTRGGNLILKNCNVNLNIGIEGKPTTEMYIAGIVGCHKNAGTFTAKATQTVMVAGVSVSEENGKVYKTKMGFSMSADCSVSGNIRNNAVSTYKNANSGGYMINKYYNPSGSNSIKLDGHSQTCNNTLTVSGLTTVFEAPDKTY